MGHLGSVPYFIVSKHATHSNLPCPQWSSLDASAARSTQIQQQSSAAAVCWGVDAETFFNEFEHNEMYRRAKHMIIMYKKQKQKTNEHNVKEIPSATLTIAAL